MKRVLYINNEDRQIGGSSLSLLSLLQALEGEVAPVLLFREEGPVSAFFREKGYTCLVIPFYRASFSPTGWRRVLRFGPHALARCRVQARCVRRVIRLAGPLDAVHSNSSGEEIGLAIAARLRIPHIWHLREYYDRLPGVHPFPSWSSWRRKLSGSDAVIAITPGLFAHWGLDRHPRAYCLPDAVMPAAAQVPRDAPKKEVLFLAGSIAPHKHPEEAIRLFAQAGLPEYRLVFYGHVSDALRASLQELASTCGVSGRVQFRPFAENVRTEMARAAAVLVCSDNEGMGRVSVEAMFLSCPVVARRCAGSADVLGQGRYGGLYDTVEEGARLLSEAVSDPSSWPLQAAREEAVRNYSDEVFAQRIKDVYRQCIPSAVGRKSPLRVLVLVVTYNGLPWLERCLGSVAAQAVPGAQPGTGDAGMQVDLFVVDNDSADGSADYVEARFPQARLVRSAENLGFTGANNLGFAYAMEKDYDYVYLLNQDAWLEEGALAALLDAAGAHPDYAVLSPLQLQADGVTLDPKFAKCLSRGCGIVEGAQGKRISGALFSGPENFFPVRDGQKRKIIPLSFVMAAHWLVPVQALREVGKFAEMFPLYGQDDNWCDRARYHGWKIGVVPSARAVHDRASRRESRERILDRNYRTASLVRLADVNRPLWLSWMYVCLFTPVQALKYRSWQPFRLFPGLCRQNAALRALREETISGGRKSGRGTR